MTDFAFACDIHGMTTIETDAELLRRSLSEPSAFGELYKRHGTDGGDLQVLNAAGQQLQPDYTFGKLLPGYSWGPTSG